MGAHASGLEQVAEFLGRYDRYAVFTHLTPDGDALGSSYALCSFLRTGGKDAITVLLEDPPAKYNFQEYASYYTTLDAVRAEHFDAAVAVDCASYARLSGAKDLFSSLPSLSIDHHQSNDLYADLNFVRESPATSQIIYEIFAATGMPANCVAQMGIYMGIIADTGNLSYPSTLPRSFAICAALAEDGLDTSRIAEQVFHTRSLPGTKLLGLFLRHMTLYLNNRIALSYLTHQDVQATGANVADAEGLINYARDIDTVEVAACLRELARDKYKVSLRSKGNVNVAAFAERYQGGGHPRAAGCVLEGRRSDLMDELIKGLEGLLC